MTARLRFGQRVECPNRGSYFRTQIGRVRDFEGDRVLVETPLHLVWYARDQVKPAPLPEARWDKAAKRWVQS